MAISHSPRIVRDGLVLALDGIDSQTNVSSLDIEYLIVGGGGGGGTRHAGGGGAGGVIFGSSTLNSGATNSVVVGGGASRAINDYGNTGTPRGGNGSNSTFLGKTALGGGGGGSWNQTEEGIDGGSGGGNAGGTLYAGAGLQPGSTDGGFGNSGGQSVGTGSPYNHGGGGGAGGAGNPGTVSATGNGGVGLYYGDYFGDSLGDSGYFAGGGGGGSHPTHPPSTSTGGLGGGGNEGTNDGAANTGGGGGGGSLSGAGDDGGAGGSGTVLVRYKGGKCASGGNTSTNGIYTVHSFTGSDNFVVDSTFNRTLGRDRGYVGLVNGVTKTNGIYTLDGTNDYLTTAVPLQASTSAYSLEAVFKAHTQKTQVIWEQNTSSLIAGRRVCMILISTGYGGFNGQNADFHSSVPYSTNTWYHWIITVDTSLGSNKIKIYVNGSLYAQGNPTSTLNAGADVAYIGRKGSTSGEYFDGEIPLVRVYDRVLTSTEANSNYNALKTRFNI